MKKWTIAGFSLILLLSLLFGCSTPAPSPAPTQPPAPAPSPAATAKPAPSPTPAAKPIVLRFAHAVASGHPSEIAQFRWFKEETEKRSQGRIKFDYFPAEQLIKAADAIQGLQSKVADLGGINVSLFAGPLPLSQALQLPLAWHSGMDVAKASKELRLALQPEYDKQNLIALSVGCSAPYHIVTRDKQVKVLEDMKGLKLRSSGGISTKTINLLGATAVSLSATDLFMSMQTRVIDGAYASISQLEAYSLKDLVKYVAITNLATMNNVQAINKDVWNTIPRDLQDLMLEVGDGVAANQGARLGEEDQRVMKDWLEKNKGIAYTPPASEMARWRDRTAPLWDEFVKGTGSQGQKVIDIFKKYAK